MRPTRLMTGMAIALLPLVLYLLHWTGPANAQLAEGVDAREWRSPRTPIPSFVARHQPNGDVRLKRSYSHWSYRDLDHCSVRRNVEPTAFPDTPSISARGSSLIFSVAPSTRPARMLAWRVENGKRIRIPRVWVQPAVTAQRAKRSQVREWRVSIPSAVLEDGWNVVLRAVWRPKRRGCMPRHSISTRLRIEKD